MPRCDHGVDVAEDCDACREENFHPSVAILHAPQAWLDEAYKHRLVTMPPENGGNWKKPPMFRIKPVSLDERLYVVTGAQCMGPAVLRIKGYALQPVPSDTPPFTPAYRHLQRVICSDGAQTYRMHSPIMFERDKNEILEQINSRSISVR